MHFCNAIPRIGRRTWNLVARKFTATFLSLDSIEMSTFRSAIHHHGHGFLSLFSRSFRFPTLTRRRCYVADQVSRRGTAGISFVLQKARRKRGALSNNVRRAGRSGYFAGGLYTSGKTDVTDAENYAASGLQLLKKVCHRIYSDVPCWRERNVPHLTRTRPTISWNATPNIARCQEGTSLSPLLS